MLTFSESSCGARCGKALCLQCCSDLLDHSPSLGREKMIKSGRGPKNFCALRTQLYLQPHHTKNPRSAPVIKINYLGALSRLNAILILQILALPPILAHCRVHRPWALFREDTVLV